MAISLADVGNTAIKLNKKSFILEEQYKNSSRFGFFERSR